MRAKAWARQCRARARGTEAGCLHARNARRKLGWWRRWRGIFACRGRYYSRSRPLRDSTPVLRPALVDSDLPLPIIGGLAMADDGWDPSSDMPCAQQALACDAGTTLRPPPPSASPIARSLVVRAFCRRPPLLDEHVGLYLALNLENSSSLPPFQDLPSPCSYTNSCSFIFSYFRSIALFTRSL